MDEKAKNMRDIPVYPHSGLYARFSGELEQYRQSRQADKECRKAIDAVFDAAWDGMRLPAEAGKSLMDRFGAERMSAVLADTIQQRRGDGRFSQKNRDWAQSVPMLVPQDLRWDTPLKCHSAKLDGLITQLRPELEQCPMREERREMLQQIPIYQNTLQYAMEHNEAPQYAASHDANVACKEAMEAAIAYSFRDNVLSDAGGRQVVEQYGYDRALFVLANTVRHQEWDGRISRDNVEWAKAQPNFDDRDSMNRDVTREYVVGSTGSPGLTNLLLNQIRRDYEQELSQTDAAKENPLRNAETLSEDDPNMIDGIINNGARESGPPSAESRQENREPSKKESIRKQLAAKPPEQEKPAPKPRRREAAL